MTWATSVPILVFLGLCVLELGPMYATDRQTEVRQKHHNNENMYRYDGPTLCRRATKTVFEELAVNAAELNIYLCYHGYVTMVTVVDTATVSPQIGQCEQPEKRSH